MAIDLGLNQLWASGLSARSGFSLMMDGVPEWLNIFSNVYRSAACFIDSSPGPLAMW
jgi:hypothetical protein